MQTATTNPDWKDAPEEYVLADLDTRGRLRIRLVDKDHPITQTVRPVPDEDVGRIRAFFNPQTARWILPEEERLKTILDLT